MKFMSLACAILLASAAAHGQGMPPAPAPIPEGAIVHAATPVSLYHNVRYKDLRNIHPCAVEKIVAVPDPCPNPCNACAPSCVYVRICVPPCDCYETKCSKHGNKIKYDFGKYEVEITSGRGVVTVDYDD